MKDLITLKEAAEMLGVHKNTVRNYLDKKVLTKYQPFPGASVKLDREQVEKFFKAVE